ncbi:hypothetical protein AALP_AA5G125100 [Arabis alpina]|uniref:Uncharacterized protein n=1 Tax=Arabis alpina TaxID=50452 RepID=A0A087GWN1_ARAAL|nr:hypothetical protein AALP_AA5G125100 [Arabis alpina]
MESKGVPIYKVLAAYILPPKLKRIEIFLDKLEEKGPQGTALATLRRSERLLFSDEYRYLLRPKEYKALMTMYMDRGEKEDLRRLWNLAKNDMKLLDGKGYSLTILAFVTKEDIEGAQEVLEGWDNGIFHVEVRDVLDFRYQRKRVMEEAELVVEDMLEDHNEEEEKKNRAMEVRQNGWNPKKNLALAAYASAQYVEGRRDIESAVDVLRLLGTQDPQDGNNDRLSRKMVEAMIGGGYFGEQE